MINGETLNHLFANNTSINQGLSTTNINQLANNKD